MVTYVTSRQNVTTINTVCLYFDCQITTGLNWLFNGKTQTWVIHTACCETNQIPDFFGKGVHLIRFVCLSVCLSRRIAQKYHPDWLDFFTQVLYAWPVPPLRWPGSGLNLFKNSSPLGDKTCHISTPRRQRALWWKHALWHHMCVIASKGLSSPIALLWTATPTGWDFPEYSTWHTPSCQVIKHWPSSHLEHLMNISDITGINVYLHGWPHNIHSVFARLI